MALDWTLASLHHLAVFSLAALLACELALTSGEIEQRTIVTLARVDAGFGAMAALTLAAGLCRVFFAAKGPEYYVANTLFWIKMALFATIATISILPTLQYLVWRRAARLDAGFRPKPLAVAGVRRWLWIDAALFAFIPIAAAGMARDYGMWD